VVKQIGCAILVLTMVGAASAKQPDKKCKRDCEPAPTPSIKAPELDTTAAIAGLTVMLGGLAVLRGRRAKVSKT
jgi:hypothetical protein